MGLLSSILRVIKNLISMFGGVVVIIAACHFFGVFIGLGIAVTLFIGGFIYYKHKDGSLREWCNKHKTISRMSFEWLWAFNPMYWIFIILGLISHLIAIFLTWYGLTYLGAQECNAAMDSAISSQGFFLTGALSMIVLYVLYAFTISLFEEKDKVTWTSIGSLSLVTAVLSFDALNDILAVMNHPYHNITVGIAKVAFSFLGIGTSC